MLADDLMPYLLPDLPNCPPLIAKRALMFATVELCRETLCWNDFLDPVPLSDQQNVYDVYPPSGSVVTRLIDVKLPSGPLLPKTMGEIALLIPNWEVEQSSVPRYYNSPNSLEEVRVFPIPFGSVDSLIMRAAFQPAMSATDIPDEVVNHHFETLLNGARSRLFATPRKPWSDPQLAGFYAGLFEAKKVELRIAQYHDNVVGSLTAQAPAFGF